MSLIKKNILFRIMLKNQKYLSSDVFPNYYLITVKIGDTRKLGKSTNIRKKKILKNLSASFNRKKNIN